jgi:hypothetical protein
VENDGDNADRVVCVRDAEWCVGACVVWGVRGGGQKAVFSMRRAREKKFFFAKTKNRFSIFDAANRMIAPRTWILRRLIAFLLLFVD